MKTLKIAMLIACAAALSVACAKKKESDETTTAVRAVSATTTSGCNHEKADVHMATMESGSHCNHAKTVTAEGKSCSHEKGVTASAEEHHCDGKLAADGKHHCSDPNCPMLAKAAADKDADATDAKPETDDATEGGTN